MLDPSAPFYVNRLRPNASVAAPSGAPIAKHLEYFNRNGWQSQPACGQESVEAAFKLLDEVSCNEVREAFVADRWGRKVNRDGTLAE